MPLWAQRQDVCQVFLSLFAQGMQLRRILDATREQGADFQLIHHTTRAASKLYEPPNLSDAAWAGFPEFVGQWMLVARRERYMAGSGLHKLFLELGARGEHQAGWAVDVDEKADEWGKPQGWSVSIRPAAEVRFGGTGMDQARQKDETRERAIEKAMERIVKAGGKFPEGETEKRIRGWAGLDGGAVVKEAFARLLNDGTLEEVEIPKPNRRKPYSGFRIVT